MKLCKFNHAEIQASPKKYYKLVKKPRYLCLKCGRLARKDKYLCKPIDIKDI